MLIEKESWLIGSESQQNTDASLSHGARLLSHVAAGSPADQLGLKVGDSLISVNGMPLSGSELLTFLAEHDGPVDYVFHNPSNGTRSHYKTTTMPLGFIAEPSTKDIVKKLSEEGALETEEIKMVWERQEWHTLLKISDSFVYTNMLFKFIRLFKKDFWIHAMFLFHGAALYELGKEQKGIELISLFMNHSINNYDSATQQIAYYYAARWAEKQNDHEQQQYYLRIADHNSRSGNKLIDREISAKYQGLREAPFRWKNQEFPIHYVLRSLDGKSTASFESAVHSMTDKELLPICVMPSYRGNGPYDDAMRCYRAMFPHLSSVLRPLHIITDTREKRVDRDYWYENETQAEQSGVPFELLFDEDGLIASVLELEFSPVFFVVNNAGVVCYEGVLNAPDTYWEILNLLDV